MTCDNTCPCYRRGYSLGAADMVDQDFRKDEVIDAVRALEAEVSAGDEHTVISLGRIIDAVRALDGGDQ